MAPFLQEDFVRHERTLSDQKESKPPVSAAPLYSDYEFERLNPT